MHRWLKYMELLDEIVALWTAIQHKLLFCETVFEAPLAKMQLPDAFTAFHSATGLYSVRKCTCSSSRLTLFLNTQLHINIEVTLKYSRKTKSFFSLFMCRILSNKCWLTRE